MHNMSGILSLVPFKERRRKRSVGTVSDLVLATSKNLEKQGISYINLPSRMLRCTLSVTSAQGLLGGRRRHGEKGM